MFFSRVIYNIKGKSMQKGLNSSVKMHENR